MSKIDYTQVNELLVRQSVDLEGDLATKTRELFTILVFPAEFDTEQALGGSSSRVDRSFS